MKYAASLLGLSTSEARLPLSEIKDTTKSAVHDAMARVGLVEVEAQTND